MLEPPCEIDLAAVVFLGKFNPAIFKTAWFALQNLVKRTEAEAARRVIATEDYSSFALPLTQNEELAVEITRERCTFTSGMLLAPTLRDIATQTFKLLEHTPLSAVGLNRMMHFRMPSEADRDALGYRLAPPAAVPKQCLVPAMASLAIRYSRSPGGPRNGTIRVEPSVSIAPTGVFIAVSDHFDVPTERGTAMRASEIVEENWDESSEFARSVAGDLVMGRSSGI
jgi:hypothetical protein